MSCTVNKDAPLLQNYEINIAYYEGALLCNKIFGKREPENYNEENIKLKIILSNLLQHRITYAGIQEYHYDRALDFSYIVSWVTYNNSPKMCVILYLDENNDLKTFIPRRGNTVIGEDKIPLGWDVGYDFDISLWCQDYPEQVDLIKTELGLEDEEEIYEIVHNGILEPDYTLCKAEFEAYVKFNW